MGRAGGGTGGGQRILVTASRLLPCASRGKKDAACFHFFYSLTVFLQRENSGG